MKSKSFEVPQNSNVKVQNKSFDFIKYYQPSTENNVNKLAQNKSEDVVSNDNTPKVHVSKRSQNKKKKKVTDDNINVSRTNNESDLPQNPKSPSTSTPNIKSKRDLNESVKSIIKNSDATNSLNVSAISVSKQKPKKRNKSVSFMLEETEELIIKRSKSELSVVDNKNNKKPHKKHKKSKDGKENLVGESNVEMDNSDKSNETTKKGKKSENNETSEVAGKKEKKKNKYPKLTDSIETENQTDVETKEVIKDKKPRKKKNQEKHAQKKSETEDEPVAKIKKVIKPDGIAADLENLSIGDNAHTLTNLLDEMTVVDKKKKKNKRKPKNKKQVTDNASTDQSEITSEEKEKVKWRKRKWNKDKKGGISDNKMATLLIIENLPLKLMCSYKKLLTELFDKFGPIKSIGVAEVYCIELPEVFTTTINFDSEDAANKALEEDNTLFEGSRIRVKRPLPPSETTLVVRSYAELTELALSSVFTNAGRIRNVRRLVKGKKSMCTAFIEFDGPEAVERGIKMAEDVKIGGKKIFAAKFDLRHSNKNKKFKAEKATDNDAGSDDSSD